VHRRPDRVLEAVAAPPVERPGVDQFVQRGAELPQRRAVRPGSAVRDAVRVLLRQRERGGEQPGFLAGERQVRGADRAQPEARRLGLAVVAAHAGDAGGHPAGELVHGRRADRREELVPVGEVPVGGVGHHAHHPGRLAEHHGVRAAGAGQLQPRGDQAVADGATRATMPLGGERCPRTRFPRWSAGRHRARITKWTASTKHVNVDSVH
jgi:hypothetical protein